MGIGVLSRGQSGQDVKSTTPPCSAEFRNEWSYTTAPQYAFMAWTGTTFLTLKGKELHNLFHVCYVCMCMYVMCVWMYVMCVCMYAMCVCMYVCT